MQKDPNKTKQNQYDAMCPIVNMLGAQGTCSIFSVQKNSLVLIKSDFKGT